MVTEVISLIQTLGGIVGGLGLGIFTRSGKVKAQADAYKLMAEAYEYRINAANERIKTANETEASHLQRISELNHALDDKTDIIRKYVADLTKAEQEINRVNVKLVDAQTEIGDLKAEIGELKLKLEHYREWRCYWHDCQDPRGRKPEQKRVHTEDGKDFEE